MLQEDLASGRTAAEAAKEADARREANRRRREAEAAAEVKSPVLVRQTFNCQGSKNSSDGCALSSIIHPHGMPTLFSLPIF